MTAPFADGSISESVTLMSGFLKMRAAWQVYFSFRVRRVAANELSPSGPKSEHAVPTESLYVPDALTVLKE